MADPDPPADHRRRSDANRPPEDLPSGADVPAEGDSADRAELGRGKRNIRLVLAYDGTGLAGWQIQPNGPSVQEELARAIERVTGVRSVPIGSGRTDAGVHAIAQVANFRTDSDLPAETFLNALNHYLPDAIVVQQAAEVDLGFHARKDAAWKLYRYVFHDGPAPDPFLRPYCWRTKHRLDEGAMDRAAAALVGTHDFRSFETEWPNRASSVRTIRRCRMGRLGPLVHLDVESNGFLYNMVRSIAGTLAEVGRGRRPVSGVADALASMDRTAAGPTAPAKGLFLIRVTYDRPADSAGRAGANDR